MKKYEKAFWVVVILCWVYEGAYAQSIPTITINNTAHNNQNIQYVTSGNIVSPSVPTAPTSVAGTGQVHFVAGNEVNLKAGFSASGITGSGFFHAVVYASAFNVVFIEPNSTYPQVPKHEKLEIGLQLPANVEQLVDNYFIDNTTGINPYDYTKINIEATFTKGSLTRKMYGFYYKDFVRNTTTNQWDPVHTDYRWRVRFAPDAIGTWSCSITITFASSLNLAPLTVSNTAFACVTNPDPEEKGPVVVGTARYFELLESGGNSFFPIGQNLGMFTYGGWFHPDFTPNPHAQDITDYQAHQDAVESLADNSGNYFRLIMGAPGYEVQYEKLGDYDHKQHSAWELDRVMKQLYQRNVYMQLSFFDYGEFSMNNAGTFYGWDYPYNASHGGYPAMHSYSPYKDVPGITAARDVFRTGSAADDFVKRKIRYIISRWGYNTHLTYEIMNEIDNACEYYDDCDDPTTQHRPYFTDVTLQADVDHWQTDVVAPYIKNLDEDRHILTTSYSAGPFSSDQTLHDPNMDFVSIHHYSPDPECNRESPNGNSRSSAIKNVFTGSNPINKPAGFGEMGLGGPYIDGASLCSDERFHDDLWATAFLGSYGAGLNWWNMGTDAYRANFAPLKSFFSNVRLVFDSYYPEYNHISEDDFACNTSDGKIEYYAMKSGNGSLAVGWAHNKYYSFENLFYPEYFPVCSTKAWVNYYDATGYDEAIVLSNMEWYQHYKIHWYNTRTGAPHSVNYALSGDVNHCSLPNELKIPAPGLGFNTPDLAFKVEHDDTYYWKKESTLGMHDPADRTGDLMIAVFPNPTTNMISVGARQLIPDATVEITDVLGKIVYSKRFAVLSNEGIDISGLQSGVYLVQVRNDDVNEAVKIIKQ